MAEDYGTQFGLANKAIASVADLATREALLATRSEFYTVMRELGSRDEALREMSHKVAEQLTTFVAVSTQEARASAQRAESTQRIYEQFTTDFRSHLIADETFQKTVMGKFDGWRAWLITGLTGLLGTSWVAIGAFVWQGLKH